MDEGALAQPDADIPPSVLLAELDAPARNTNPPPLTERISQGMPSYSEPEPEIAGNVGSTEDKAPQSGP